MTGHTNRRSSRSCLERQDLWAIDPRDDIDRAPEYEHVQEEEGDGGDGSVLLVEREQDGAHHHADAQSADADHHGFAAAHAVERERGNEISDDEHQFYEAGDELGFARGETDALDEEGGHVVDDPYPLLASCPYMV